MQVKELAQGPVCNDDDDFDDDDDDVDDDEGSHLYNARICNAGSREKPNPGQQF